MKTAIKKGKEERKITKSKGLKVKIQRRMLIPNTVINQRGGTFSTMRSDHFLVDVSTYYCSLTPSHGQRETRTSTEQDPGE